jgi:hypothetical protein
MTMRRCPILALLCLTLAGAPASSAQENEDASTLQQARTAHAGARLELAEASVAVTRAQVARMRVERLIEGELRGRPELLEARRRAAETARHQEELRGAVRKELQQDPQYRSLLASVQEADARLQAAHAQESASLTSRVGLIHELMAARAKLTRFEAAAYALDPAIEDARLAMNAAHEQATRLERAYRAQAKLDARLSAADDEIAHARSRLGKARESVARAAENLRIAEEREALRKASRRVSPPPVRRQEP